MKHRETVIWVFTFIILLSTIVASGCSGGGEGDNSTSQSTADSGYTDLWNRMVWDRGIWQ